MFLKVNWNSNLISTGFRIFDFSSNYTYTYMGNRTEDLSQGYPMKVKIIYSMSCE